MIKWVEARALRKEDLENIVQFLYEAIIIWFGCPLEIISDQGVHFLNQTIEILMSTFMISHQKSMPYYPRANKQVESLNKIIEYCLRKIYDMVRFDWVEKLPFALWAFRTIYKRLIEQILFQLVYGTKSILPTEFEILSLRIVMECQLDDFHSLRQRLEELVRLEEKRYMAKWLQSIEK